MTSWLEIGLSNALLATVLAAVALAVTRFTRRPQLAFLVWMLVLAKLLVPPLVSVPFPSLRPPVQTSDVSDVAARPIAPLVFAPDASIDVLRDSASQTPGELFEARAFDAREPFKGPAAEFTPIELGGPLVDLERTKPGFAFSPASFLIATWLVVSACWLAVAVTRMARFARVLSYARHAPLALQQEVKVLAGRLGVRRVPRVKLVKRRIPPLVWALFGEPVILLPAGLLRILSPQQRSTLLVHELAHLKRRDHLARMLELTALCLYWWHPVAWWARRNAQRAAEQCCDAEVVAHFPDAACAYAEALVTTVDFLSDAPGPLPLGANGFSQAVHVKRRIEMILQANPVQRPVRPLRLILLAVGLAALPLSLRTLWAEPAESNDEPAAEAAAEPAAADESQPEPQPDPPPAPAAAPAADSIEQRLDRLERMIESLAGQMQKRQTAATPVQVQFPKDLDRELADVWKQAKRNIELGETNHNRKLAATRQAEALKAAYEADTVTLDQLLEAQRRAAEAEMTHARIVCELCADPERRQYLLAAAGIAINNKALNEARQTWQRINVRDEAGSTESKAEAQAREQFYQFKSQTQTLLDEWLKVAARKKMSQASSDIAYRRELNNVRHFQLHVEGEKAKLKAARKKLVETRGQVAKGEVSQDEVRKLEHEIGELERRVIYRFEQLTAAVQLLLDRSGQSLLQDSGDRVE